MNYELFIVRQIIAGKAAAGRSATQSILRIAVIGVALSMAVMLISLAVVTGFKKEIRDKVIGFGGHIQITNFDENHSLELKPLDKNQAFYNTLNQTPGIRHIQVFATKAGIIKTDEDIEGILLKGIGSDFDWDFFRKKIVQGRILLVNDTVKSNDIIISKTTSQRLKIKLGNDLLMYFIQKPPRVRKFKVCGIYDTGMTEFDKLFAICDIGHIQKLNDWKPTQVGGFEVLINDFEKLDELGKVVYNNIGYNLNARSIREIYPSVFSWLQLQDINVVIIITLMLLVAGINMITALLILILERTSMIGILKALGAKDWGIRKVFLYLSIYLTGQGLLYGNAFGLLLCLIQEHFGLIKLPAESYYMSVVPINIPWLEIILLNIGSVFVCFIMLIFPSFIISKIKPVKAIRFN